MSKSKIEDSIYFFILMAFLFMFPIASYSGEGDLKWSFNTEGHIISSPAIGLDGTIYVGSGDKKLYAINPDGTKKWAFTTGNVIYSSPAIGNDGTIYVGSNDGNLYAINPNGTQKWFYPLGSAIISSPAIDKSETIYIGSLDGNLYAINSDGTKKWSFDTGGYIYSSPAIDKDQTIYIGSYSNNLYAINPDGTKKWIFPTKWYIFSSPSIGIDGTIYIGSWDNNLYAIKPDGKEKWTFSTGGDVNSSPIIGNDGTIYVGSFDKNVYAITSDGKKKWAFDAGLYVESTPAIGSDNTIYVGSDAGNLYAIKPDGTKKWAFATDGPVISNPTIGSDGTIYVGSNDGKLYAIQGSGALADSPWPMFQKNVRHNSRVNNSQLAPALSVVPGKFTFYVSLNQNNQINQTFNISNSGDGLINWDAKKTVNWLSISPTNGTNSGEIDKVNISIDILGLNEGKYKTDIIISSPEAANSPQVVTVNLYVSSSQIHKYYLKSGWNLISFQVNNCYYYGTEPSGIPDYINKTNVASLGFSSMKEWFSSILIPNNPVDDVWDSVFGIEGFMDRKLPDSANSLKYISPLSGYWVKISKASEGATLTLTGNLFDLNNPIPLVKGWNLIGYPSTIAFYGKGTKPDVLVPDNTQWKSVLSGSPVEYVFSDIQGKYNYIFSGEGLYNSSLPPVANSLNYIAPGLGYWIKVSENLNLFYPKE